MTRVGGILVDLMGTRGKSSCCNPLFASIFVLDSHFDPHPNGIWPKTIIAHGVVMTSDQKVVSTRKTLRFHINRVANFSFHDSRFSPLV